MIKKAYWFTDERMRGRESRWADPPQATLGTASPIYWNHPTEHIKKASLLRRRWNHTSVESSRAAINKRNQSSVAQHWNLWRLRQSTLELRSASRLTIHLYYWLTCSILRAIMFPEKRFKCHVYKSCTIYSDSLLLPAFPNTNSIRNRRTHLCGGHRKNHSRSSESWVLNPE